MIGALVFLKSLSDAVKKRDFLFLAGGVGGGFCRLNCPCNKKNYYLKVYEFLEIRVNAFVTKLRDNIGFRQPCWYPSDGHQHGVSLQRSINLGKLFLRISRT